MDQIVSELKALNEKADAIIGIMQRPENRLYRLLEILSNAVGIIGVLAIVELVRTWISGG
ncbi:MAG: hypothetical protein FWD88_06275 [Treponema sp.]|nr:hypothetical protein [Treponema sp.]